ncbi:MAG: hypothetical protein ABW194_03615 [Novosphingobium sp.]
MIDVQPRHGAGMEPDVVTDLLHSDEMKDVAGNLLRGYLVLLSHGHHQRTIAHAMLGATLNLYDLLERSSELPELLRAIADRLEYGRAPS